MPTVVVTPLSIKGIGKVKPIKVLHKTPKYSIPLSKLGDNWSVSNELINELDSLTCAMYGKGRMTSVNTVRQTKINDICSGDGVMPSKNVDMGTLPPCRKSLTQHIRRVNYQVGIWKRAHISNPEVPDPVGHGWVMVDGKLEPLWYDGRMLPQQLVDAADASHDDNYESDDDSDMEDIFLAPAPQANNGDELDSDDE